MRLLSRLHHDAITVKTLGHFITYFKAVAAYRRSHGRLYVRRVRTEPHHGTDSRLDHSSYSYAPSRMGHTTYAGHRVNQHHRHTVSRVDAYHNVAHIGDNRIDSFKL